MILEINSNIFRPEFCLHDGDVVDVSPNGLAMVLLDTKDASGKPAAAVCTDPARRAKALPISHFTPKDACVSIEITDWLEQLGRQRNLSPELMELTDRIAGTENEIGRLREEIRSFQNLALEDGFQPLALPADWSYEQAQAELHSLLQTRLTNTAKLREVVEQSKVDESKAQEKALAKLTKEHQAVCVEVLAAEIALAKVCQRERALCQDAADLVGRECGPLQSFSPIGCRTLIHGFDADSMNSTLATRIREAISMGVVKRSDPLLAGLKF